MSSGSSVPERYRIGDLLVDSGTRQVTREGREVVLPGLSFDLLLALARHAPRILSADELMEQVWPGRVVNVETVAKRVELVREALGDDSEEPRYIALVRGRGYRLIAPVQPAVPAPAEVAPAPEQPQPAPRRQRRVVRWAGLAIASVAIASVIYFRVLSGGADPDRAPLAANAAAPSLAVLPFLNLSDDASNLYLSDGIAEELRGRLAKVPRLRVASRTSSFSFRNRETPLREIARALNVDHILEGSVRKAGNRVRVSAQLIDVASDSQLWSRTYERELQDIFAIQDEISRSIVGLLRSTLAPEESGLAAGSRRLTNDLEAYQLYLRGRHLWNVRGESNIRQSIQLLERSTQLDPNFAEAHAALAGAYATTTFYYRVPEEQALERSARAAARAIELNPTLSEPYGVQGLLAAQQMQWMQAQTAFERAFELNSNDSTARYWLGELYYVTGRTRDALPVMLEALELDPIFATLLRDVGELYVIEGDYEKGCAYIQRAADVSVTMYAWLALAHCHEHDGNMQAMQDAERAAERAAGLSSPVLALVRRALENTAEKPAALAALKEASRGGLEFMYEQRRLGDVDGALDVLEASLRLRNFNPLRGLWSPDARELRAHPRFRTLVEQFGLIDYWRQAKWPDLCRPDGDGLRCD
jgi:adenylate cyclase